MIDVIIFTAAAFALVGLVAFATIIALYACNLMSRLIALQQLEIQAARRVFGTAGRSRSRARARTRRSSSAANDPPPPYPSE